MGARRIMLGLMTALLLCTAQQGSRQRRWAMYEHEMQNPADDPPDAWEKTEFAFAAAFSFRTRRVLAGAMGNGCE